MSLGDFFGKIAGTAVKKIQEEYSSYEKYVENYRKMDDERLIKYFKEERNNTKKFAMAKVLKERGYGNGNDYV